MSAPLRVHELARLLTTPPDHREPSRQGEFWMPDAFGDGRFWLGRFDGLSAWELHPDTDELPHVLEGAVEVTVLASHGPATRLLEAGSVLIAPRGHWHRLRSIGRVVHCGVTPGRTLHSTADDPRADPTAG